MRIIRNKASAGGSCGIVVTLLVRGPDPANHFLPLGFDLANQLLRRGGLWIVSGAPACQLEHHRQEIEPLGLGSIRGLPYHRTVRLPTAKLVQLA